LSNFLNKVSLQEKYPEATDSSICSLIGGYFFHRLINPAIVTPAAYSLVDESPDKYPQRTLLTVRHGSYLYCRLLSLHELDCNDAESFGEPFVDPTTTPCSPSDSDKPILERPL
jgi:hypothetical protein